MVFFYKRFVVFVWNGSWFLRRDTPLQLGMSAPLSLFGEDFHGPERVQEYERAIEYFLKLSAAYHEEGDTVMLVRLKTLHHNSVFATVTKPHKAGRVSVLLKDGKTQISVLPKNVLALNYSHVNEPDHKTVPLYDYCRIEEEGGKNRGMVATRDIPADTMLSHANMCGFNVADVLLNCGVEGRAWDRQHFIGPSTAENEAVMEPMLQDLYETMVNGLCQYQISCQLENRFLGHVCLYGGCGLCGPSATVIAAMRGVTVPVWRNSLHRGPHNVMQFNLCIDREHFLAYLQLPDAIYIVNCILLGLKELPLDGSQGRPRERAMFIAYAWDCAAMWIDNSFCQYHEVDTIRSMYSAFWPMAKHLHLEHLVMFDMHMHKYNQDQNKTPADTAYSKIILAKIDETQRALEHRPRPSKPVFGFEPGGTQGTGMCADIRLYPLEISSINGARDDDECNVKMIHYFKTPPGKKFVYERDHCCLLQTQRPIRKGEFLCLEYNGSKREGQVEYFSGSLNLTTLYNMSREHTILQALASMTADVCGHVMPESVEAHLRACAL